LAEFKYLLLTSILNIYALKILGTFLSINCVFYSCWNILGLFEEKTSFLISIKNIQLSYQKINVKVIHLILLFQKLDGWYLLCIDTYEDKYEKKNKNYTNSILIIRISSNQ
jgi:hypothetical protein